METEEKIELIGSALEGLYLTINLDEKALASTQDKLQNLQKFQKNIGIAERSIACLVEFFKNTGFSYLDPVANQRKFKLFRDSFEVAQEAVVKLRYIEQIFNQNSAHLQKVFEDYKGLKSLYLESISDSSLQESVEEEKQESNEIDSLLLSETTEVIKPIKSLHDVKDDQDYDLFYLMTREGDLFYTHHLEKNIKLLCLFGDEIANSGYEDPLLKIQLWRDEIIHCYARHIYLLSYDQLKKIFQETNPIKDNPLFKELRCMSMALMMANNPLNLMKSSPVKTCSQYFEDFRVYLRQSLDLVRTQEYKTLNNDEQQRKVISNVEKLLEVISYHLFTQKSVTNFLYRKLENLIRKAFDRLEPMYSIESSDFLSVRLLKSHKAVSELLKLHPNGPLFKSLDLILEKPQIGFDPLLLGCLPQQCAQLQIGQRCVELIKMPTPTTQHFSDEAYLAEEFTLFLEKFGESKEGRKILLVNLQQRCSWKESTRSQILEKLPYLAAYNKYVSTISLDRHSSFYLQQGAHDKSQKASSFIPELLDYWLKEHKDMYIASPLRKELLQEFIPKVVNTVHETLFNKEINLVAQDKRHFIKMVDVLVQLKIMQTLKIDTVCLICKDGIDLSTLDYLELFFVVQKIKGIGVTSADYESVFTNVFIPSLVQRERLVNKELFSNTMSFIIWFERQINKKEIAYLLNL